jgi:hypothetical protein
LLINLLGIESSLPLEEKKALMNDGFWSYLQWFSSEALQTLASLAKTISVTSNHDKTSLNF